MCESGGDIGREVRGKEGRLKGKGQTDTRRFVFDYAEKSELIKNKVTLKQFKIYSNRCIDPIFIAFAINYGDSSK